MNNVNLLGNLFPSPNGLVCKLYADRVYLFPSPSGDYLI